MSIKPQVNKNIFLLFTMLNAHDLAHGSPESSQIRAELIKHFSNYNGPTPDENKYIHNSKLVFWALCVGDAPNFERKDLKLEDYQEQEYRYGSYIKPFLQDFYKNTNFEDYYKNILPELNEITSSIENMLKETDLQTILEETWGIELKSDYVIIPNPLSEGSFGPHIEDTSYQVVSIFDDNTMKIVKNLILHEGSHPVAKKLLYPHLDKLKEKKEILEKAFENENYPDAYKNWQTCYEEHLIRAVQGGFLLPKVRDDFDIEKALDYQEKNNGMIYIKQFYDVLKEYRNVKDALPELLELPR